MAKRSGWQGKKKPTTRTGCRCLEKEHIRKYTTERKSFGKKKGHAWTENTATTVKKVGGSMPACVACRGTTQGKSGEPREEHRRGGVLKADRVILVQQRSRGSKTEKRDRLKRKRLSRRFKSLGTILQKKRQLGGGGGENTILKLQEG